ncbi:ABC transporter ATP-binding protein [Gordoniibacillus kamchatkensis]|uniref:ABC transporter ATP-binding protein n=1 Tax=Gordoniibacillus kamchatkensis TaxID=1590651 RepID=A0ABR5AH38_9BACL|nr:ABC-F family ATP-binding cassette domain-containing protein [Paenibacillus sp. VKM B-2647]KIL40322.1 ABC transporter ATP-binding protein [Paenibacillus sp. VKM B-2647]
MSLLTVENLTHAYADKSVFRDVSFRLLRGEHAGLVGGNGAGKSTLLRILAGDVIPDRGTVKWLPDVKYGFLRQHLDLQAGTTIRLTLQGAFAHLYDMEKRMRHIAEQMAAGAPDAEPLERLLAQYGELQTKLEQSRFYELDARIEEVAAGLGLLELGLEREVDKLSGGQRTKLLLGTLLLEEPDVLLLDEPTNFLDEAHIDWLTKYLKVYEHAFLVVSHDERFLNEIAGTIFHLEHQQLGRYAGNYKAFLASYEQSKQQLQDAYIRQQHEIARLETFIQKNKVRKAKQAKSREKMLEKMERIDRPTTAPRPRFTFNVTIDPVTRVIEAKQIQIGYTKPLFAPRDLQISRGDKIAIVGSNGIGKSTLLKTLLGHVEPMGGTVHIGERVRAGYYAQEHAVSELTPLERLTTFRRDLKEKDIRKTLAMAGLTDKHIRQPLRALSGGEQAKARLSELMLTDCNFLVLDEPTNHLDVLAKEALRQALEAYDGTIVVVTHEPDFYAGWVTDIWQVEKW